ncbi:hypothetical protein D7223_06680 [Micromonospora endolithica]|uniref:Uncharacterized protein n=1 Tax=Micromonospora endolithica TaxID=230091 RepID=A0A3A9ZLK7_9ACTN|nr:hypothetical protein D7223_06680 [Micromonospora endolithica]
MDLDRQSPGGEGAPEREVRTGVAVVTADDEDALRAAGEQPRDSGVAVGAKLVQLGGGRTGQLGDDQRRVGADGGGDQ